MGKAVRKTTSRLGSLDCNAEMQSWEYSCEQNYFEAGEPGVQSSEAKLEAKLQ